MIASVRGAVTALAPDTATIELGGLGFAVHCAPGTLARLRIGETAALATSLVVREDSLTLYGFADTEERGLFELLQTSSGVGPRLAQAILAVLSPDAVRGAIAAGDTATLTQVPGIGRKGADRMILELKDRIGPVVTRTAIATGDSAPWREQVHSGLTALGWSAAQASEAVNALTVDEPHPDVPVLLKQAIQMLGRVR